MQRIPSLKFRTCTAGLFTILLTGAMLISCSERQSTQTKWVATWSTAEQLVEPHNNPPEPGLTGNTLRQIVRVSIGGDSLRVKLSNEYSNSPVTIESMQISASAGGYTIDSTTTVNLSFDGNKYVTMQPGTTVVSDPFAFGLKQRMDVAFSIKFGETSAFVTGHPGSRTTSYLLAGAATKESDFAEAITTDHWYVINGIDVKKTDDFAAVAIIGNSITDGRGSGTNKQNRWPDIFSEQLLKNPSTANVGVLNLGIGGNCVLRSCLGPSALSRFQNDAINQSGVRWAIVFEGVNDLGQTPDSLIAVKVANDLIAAYQKLIEAAHANNIKIYGATITPFGKSFYYASFRESARNMVNDWIRNSGQFDAVIDFDKAIENPEEPGTMLPDAQSGDFLHPNENGHKLLGEAVDLKLFE